MIDKNAFGDLYKRGGKMIGKRTAIWKREEYLYDCEERDIPYVISYMHEDEQIRPAMIVVPGGAYRQVSPSEGDIVARMFYKAGYNVLVLTYSVNPTEEGEPLHLQPLKDLARAVRLVRYYAKQCQIDPTKVAVCGFSAGGHLCGCLGVHFQEMEEESPLLKDISCRPDAMVLGYPVITSGKYRNEDSFLALFGEEPDEEEMEYLSVEKHVTEEMPPCFLWHTLEDKTVSAENGYLFADACRKAAVPYAHHVFTEGVHGMSVATEEWFEQKLKDRPDKWTEEEQAYIHAALNEVGMWTELAKRWLEKTLCIKERQEIDSEDFIYQTWRSGLYK